MNEGVIYHGSKGEYYGDVDLWERFESGMWTPQLWDTETGTEWVKTDDGELLCLTPITCRDIPEEIQFERVRDGVRVVSESLSRSTCGNENR